MTRPTLLALDDIKFHPAFWGVERDFKQVIDSMENIWHGSSNTSMDFEETDQAYLMSIDLPGVSKNELEIEIENEKILITATRKRSFSEAKPKEEISRIVNIPEFVDKDKIHAYHEYGVLYLALPKMEKAKARKIKISEGIKESSWKKLLGFESSDNKTTVS